MKVEITKAQLRAIIDMTDDMVAMCGGSYTNLMWQKNARLIDTFLNKNGFKRKYK